MWCFPNRILQIKKEIKMDTNPTKPVGNEATNGIASVEQHKTGYRYEVF